MTELIIWAAAVSLTVVSLTAVAASRRKKTYECPACGCRFRPGINNSLRILYSFPDGGRALKCPSCGRKSIMTEAGR